MIRLFSVFQGLVAKDCLWISLIALGGDAAVDKSVADGSALLAYRILAERDRSSTKIPSNKHHERCIREESRGARERLAQQRRTGAGYQPTRETLVQWFEIAIHGETEQNRTITKQGFYACWRKQQHGGANRAFTSMAPDYKKIISLLQHNHVSAATAILAENFQLTGCADG